MPSRCTTCAHPDRIEIDQALVNLVPLRHIARNYGLSTGALRRHRARHLSKELAKAFILRSTDNFPRQDGAAGPVLVLGPQANPDATAEVIADQLAREGSRPDDPQGIAAAAMGMVEAAETQALARIPLGLDLLGQVESLRGRTLTILDTAERDHQPRTALKAIAQAADLLKLQGAFLIEMKKAEAEAPSTATEADEAWELAGARIYGALPDGP